MLVIKVEIWPGSDVTRMREIARIFASNVSELEEVSDYHIQAEEFGNNFLDIPNTYKTFEIKGHKRKTSVFNLLAKIFTECKTSDS